MVRGNVGGLKCKISIPSAASPSEAHFVSWMIMKKPKLMHKHEIIFSSLKKSDTIVAYVYIYIYKLNKKCFFRLFCVCCNLIFCSWWMLINRPDLRCSWTRGNSTSNTVWISPVVKEYYTFNTYKHYELFPSFKGNYFEAFIVI